MKLTISAAMSTSRMRLSEAVRFSCSVAEVVRRVLEAVLHRAEVARSVETFWISSRRRSSQDAEPWRCALKRRSRTATAVGRDQRREQAEVGRRR